MSDYVSQVLADNPIRYYRMNEMSGTVLHDLGSQGQNATISGTVTFAQQGLLGELIRDSDTSIIFDGTSGQVSIPSIGLPNSTSAPFTIESWVMYPTLPSTNEPSIFLGTRASGNDQEASFQFDHTTHQWFFELGPGFTSYIPDTILVGASYHLVATYDGTYLTMYLNGRQRTFVNVGAITITYGSAILGTNAANNRWYSGVLDEVAIYSTALSIDRIASHYYAGIGSSSPVAPRLSWLSVSPDGRIVNEQGEVVLLHGVNTAGLEYGDALGGKDFQTWIESFAQLAVNLWRISINVSWWNNNVAVPGSVLRYRDYIRQIIAWMKLSGCYVEIDPTGYCTIVPSKSGPYCADLGDPPSSINCIPAQNTSNNPPWTQQQKVDATIAFFQSLLPLYKDDPAILYDALNEPDASNDFSDPFSAKNQVIDAIRDLHPQALIFVYGQADLIANGSIPDYTQPNLIYDFHIYDAPSDTWQGKLAARQSIFDYAQAHARAIMIGEWSITGVTNDPQGFTNAIANLAVTQGIAVSYYTDNNLIGNDLVTPTSYGLILASAYHEIADIPGGYPFAIYTDNPIRYYRLNETLGTIAYDLGSQKQNGTITGGVTQGIPGLLRNQPTIAMSFDALTGYISLPTTGLPTGTSTWTIEAWVKTAPTLPNGVYVIAFFGTDVANKGAEIWLHTSVFKVDADGASACHSETISANTIYYVVGTYDGTNYLIYVNGQLAGGPTALTTNITAGSASIGNSPSGNFFNNIIEEVAIYDYALSAVQVDRHYLAGLGFPVRYRNV